MGIIRIGTRSSKLAMRQASIVKEYLHKSRCKEDIEVIPIKTKGDKILDVPLAKIGGKGLFVKEIEEALIRNEIDMAVHSMKDVPTQLVEGLMLGAVTKREDCRDCLVSKDNKILKHLPPNAFIGTSSLRRQSQLLHNFPNFQIVQIRGNLETRLRRAQGDDLDAVIVAAAGIHRMGLEDKVTEYMPTEMILPAIGQGALGIEIREKDERTYNIIHSLNDNETLTAILAERAFLHRLGGSCQVPIAALAQIDNARKLRLEGMVASLDGSKMIRDKINGDKEAAEEMGLELAERLLKQGAEEILQQIMIKEDIKET